MVSGTVGLAPDLVVVSQHPWPLPACSVISRAPGLKLVVETLISSLKPIGNIVLICCAFFIIFGILGVQVRGTQAGLALGWARWLGRGSTLLPNIPDLVLTVLGLRWPWWSTQLPASAELLVQTRRETQAYVSAQGRLGKWDRRGPSCTGTQASLGTRKKRPNGGGLCPGP